MLQNFKCTLFLNILLSFLLLAGCGDGKQKPSPGADTIEAEQSGEDQGQSDNQKKSKKKKDKADKTKEKKVKSADGNTPAAKPATKKPAATKPTTSTPGSANTPATNPATANPATSTPATIKPVTTNPATPIPGSANTPAANPAAEIPLDKNPADTLPLDPKPVENPQTPLAPSTQATLEDLHDATTPESVLEKYKDYDQLIYNDLVEKNDPLAKEHSWEGYQKLLRKVEWNFGGDFTVAITLPSILSHFVSDIIHVSKNGKDYDFCRFGIFNDFISATEFTSKYLDLLKKSKDKYNGTLYPKITATTITGNDGKFHTSIVTYEEEENTPPVQEKPFLFKTVGRIAFDTFMGGMNLYNSLVNKTLPVLILGQDPDERLILELEPAADLKEAIENAEVYLKLND